MNIHNPRLLGACALLALAAAAIPLVGNRASGPPRVDTTPQSKLIVADANDIAAINRVARELGIETEAFETPSLHRGASDEVVTAYWPRGRIRKAALTSFRVDVGEAYGDDVPTGTLEFKKGKKVLWRLEDFEPAAAITIARIPPEVVEAVKPGDNLTWGLKFESRRYRRHSKTVKVKIVSNTEERKVAQSLEKLEKRKYFQRQEPIVRAMLTAKTLEQRRLHSEALLNYIGILQAFPGSTSPFAGIVTSLRRLDLDETPMFEVASVFVGGRGGHANGLNAPTHGSGGSALQTGGVGPAARSMAMLAPQQQGSATLRPGGYVDLAPGVAPTPRDESDPLAEAPADDGEGTTPPAPAPAPAGGEQNDGQSNGGERNDGQSNPGNGFGPQSDDPRPDAPAASPMTRVADAETATQGLRDAIQAAAASGNATPEQMQAMHAALTDAEQALDEARRLADAAEGGNAQAQQRFDDAWTRFEDAQKRAQDAAPGNDTPGDDAPAANTAPATMADALRQLIRSGNAPESAPQLLRVLETARTADEAAVAATAAQTTAQTAATDAENAMRALGAGATQAERDAAALAVQQAQQALEQAEADAVTAREQAAQLQGAVSQAQKRFAHAAELAQELMRTE